MTIDNDPKPGGVNVHFSPSALRVAALLLPLGLIIGYLAGKTTGTRPEPAATPPPPVPQAAPAIATDAPAPGGTIVDSERVYKGNPGPWGDIDYIRIAIERPDELMDPDFPDSYQTSWFFAGRSRAQVEELLSQPDLSGEQKQRLLDTNRWRTAASGIFVTPGHDLILDLNSNARQRIYAVLAESPTNQWHFPAFAWRQDLMAQWFERSGLSPQTLAKAEKLLYRRGSSVCFSDPVALSNSLKSREEKLRLWKTLSRQATVLAKLRITTQTDIDALVRYWGKEGRAKDIRPLLESLARAPGGGKVDIVHLMSPFARRLMYTYPYPPNDSKSPQYNCTYTALNYFRDDPDDRFCNMTTARAALETDYFPLPNHEPTYGDIIALFDAKGQLLHTAVYIADEMVFTKNGAHFQQPWLLMEFGDMLAMYPSEPPPKIIAYRLKRH